MAAEQRDNSGALFKNDRKESDQHPDYTGRAMIEGVEYWLSAWIKQSGDRPKFMSISFKPKEAKPEKPTRQAQPSRAADFDDEIPF